MHVITLYENDVWNTPDLSRAVAMIFIRRGIGLPLPSPSLLSPFLQFLPFHLPFPILSPVIQLGPRGSKEAL